MCRVWEDHTWKSEGNQKQTIDERGLLKINGKKAIESTQGKETKRKGKVLSNSQVTVTRSKAMLETSVPLLPHQLDMQTSPSVGQKVRSSSCRSRNRPCAEDQFSAPKSGTTRQLRSSVTSLMPLTYETYFLQ